MSNETGPKPNIILDEDYLSPDTPYTISIKTENIAQAVFDVAALIPVSNHFPHAVIDDLQIVLTRFNPHKVAEYGTITSPEENAEESSEDVKKKVIKLQGDDIWESYNKSLESAKNIAERIEIPEWQFEEILTTRRMEKYLARAPKERGLMFAEKLLKEATNMNLSGYFIHELSHFVDDLFGRYKSLDNLGYLRYVLGDRLFEKLEGFFAPIDPREVQAFKVEYTLRSKPQYRSLVSIQGK